MTDDSPYVPRLPEHPELREVAVAIETAGMMGEILDESFRCFKEGFECSNGGELDLMQDRYAEDGEFDMSAVFTDTRPFRGHEAMRRQWDEIWESFEGMRMGPLEVFDVGGGRFVADVRLWGKGKRSGAEVDQRFAHLYTMRESDEKFVRCPLFPTV